MATEASLGEPRRISVDGQGNLYIYGIDEQNNFLIRKVDGLTGTIATVYDESDEDNEYFIYIGGIDADSDGNIYIADSVADLIWKLDPESGVISPVVGNGETGYSGDGNLATEARLNSPSSVAVDFEGNLFVVSD